MKEGESHPRHVVGAGEQNRSRDLPVHPPPRPYLPRPVEAPLTGGRRRSPIRSRTGPEGSLTTGRRYSPIRRRRSPSPPPPHRVPRRSPQHMQKHHWDYHDMSRNRRQRREREEWQQRQFHLRERDEMRREEERRERQSREEWQQRQFHWRERDATRREEQRQSREEWEQRQFHWRERDETRREEQRQSREEWEQRQFHWRERDEMRRERQLREEWQHEERQSPEEWRQEERQNREQWQGKQQQEAQQRHEEWQHYQLRIQQVRRQRVEWQRHQRGQQRRVHQEEWQQQQQKLWQRLTELWERNERQLVEEQQGQSEAQSGFLHHPSPIWSGHIQPCEIQQLQEPTKFKSELQDEVQGQQLPTGSAGHKRPREMLPDANKAGQAEATQSKSPKQARLKLKKYFDMIPVLELLESNPLTRAFKLGSGISDIDGNLAVENTEIGDFLAEGYTDEIFTVHDNDLSWGGKFKLKHMWASKNGRWVHISKRPKKRATIRNKYLDLHQLVVCLLRRYIDKSNPVRRPSYLLDYMTRVEMLMSTHIHDNEKLLSLWVLRKHPFFMGFDKCRCFIEGYYSFYKTMPANKVLDENVISGEEIKTRDDMIVDNDHGLCPNWHVYSVRNDTVLDVVYWKGREDQCPQDYYTRKSSGGPRENDISYDTYPYTGEDGYLAIFQRTLFVHGPENLKEFDENASLSLNDLAFIVAHYFEAFLPGFLIEVFTMSAHHKILDEYLSAYLKRTSVSWRNFQQSIEDIDGCSIDDDDDDDDSEPDAEDVWNGFP